MKRNPAIKRLLIGVCVALPLGLAFSPLAQAAWSTGGLGNAPRLWPLEARSLFGQVGRAAPSQALAPAGRFRLRWIPKGFPKQGSRLPSRHGSAHRCDGSVSELRVTIPDEIAERVASQASK